MQSMLYSRCHTTGRLDAEVLSVTRRVGELLQKLPRDINPVNLEELRRIKQTLVELENKVTGSEHVDGCLERVRLVLIWFILVLHL